METKDFQALIDKKATSAAEQAIRQFQSDVIRATEKLLKRKIGYMANFLSWEVPKACIEALMQDKRWSDWPPGILERRREEITKEVFSVIEPIKALFESALEDREERP